MHGIDFPKDGPIAFNPSLTGSTVLLTAAPANQDIQLWSGGKEMLRITPEGFYVRGVKVEQGDGEARAVYDGFVALLNGAGLCKLP